jgi:dipeptidyl aminopeptidase/acylaminoacyl peptidase
VTLAEPTLGGGSVWWVEGRPLEEGRQVLVRDGVDALGEGFSARTRVHEYGGGAYVVIGDKVVFSNDEDGRVYVDSEPITPEPSAPRSLRYADFVAHDGRIWCVRESHEGDGEPVNEIVSFSLDGRGEPTVVASGHDFYAAPRISPDGSRLVWLTWDHPRMPWDGTELWVAALDGSGADRVAGGPEEAIVNPEWSPDGRLHWVSDLSGWWNLYREGEPLYPARAEFAMPLWELGQTSYVFMDDGRIACAWSSRGFPHLGLLDPSSGAMEELKPEYPPRLRSLRITGDGRRLAYEGASPAHAPAIVLFDPASGALDVVRRAVDDEPDAGFVCVAEPIEFDGAHALFYPPRNADFEGPDGGAPPLIVMSHGGPTAQAEPALELATQFWTSRGFAVVDVNYGGSTGYGRAYRELLRGQWGVVDLRDCTAAAQFLTREGRVDGKRLAIRGGSAGGYTTLCALVFGDGFNVGASYYGVADLEPLFAETHKFESHYDQALIPRDKLAERSPINFIDQLTVPVIVFQGLDDPVVPPAQAERIVAALRERGIDHEYRAYKGESHGFRKAETLVDGLEVELAFYRRVLEL